MVSFVLWQIGSVLRFPHELLEPVAYKDYKQQFKSSMESRDNFWEDFKSSNLPHNWLFEYNFFLHYFRGKNYCIFTKIYIKNLDKSCAQIGRNYQVWIIRWRYQRRWWFGVLSGQGLPFNFPNQDEKFKFTIWRTVFLLLCKPRFEKKINPGSYTVLSAKLCRHRKMRFFKGGIVTQFGGDYCK